MGLPRPPPLRGGGLRKYQKMRFPQTVIPDRADPKNIANITQALPIGFPAAPGQPRLF